MFAPSVYQFSEFLLVRNDLVCNQKFKSIFIKFVVLLSATQININMPSIIFFQTCHISSNALTPPNYICQQAEFCLICFAFQRRYQEHASSTHHQLLNLPCLWFQMQYALIYDRTPHPICTRSSSLCKTTKQTYVLHILIIVFAQFYIKMVT